MGEFLGQVVASMLGAVVGLLPVLWVLRRKVRRLIPDCPDSVDKGSDGV